MTQKQKLQAEIVVLQDKVNILNRAPADTFNFGTVVVFASGQGGRVKWYYVKVAEETWQDMKNNSEKSLADWILNAHESNIGYFEVYELKPQPAPIYASA